MSLQVRSAVVSIETAILTLGKTMKALRWNSLVLLLISMGISIVWGISAGRSAYGGTLDFQGVYYGSRCLLQHCDPYNEIELENVYRTLGGEGPHDSIQHRRTVTLFVNLPTTLLFVAPFALLPWNIAQILWSVAVIGSISVATLLVCMVGAKQAEGISVFLGCLLLANCEVLFGTANTAGIVVGACVIAAVCFTLNRWIWLGILCFAISLAVKPHDAGFIWLYFVLVGGSARKNAFKALAITALMGVVAVGWLSLVAPHWISEMKSNLAQIAGPGGLNSPSPHSLTGNTAAMVINLQAILSIFRDDPHFYTPLAVSICGFLLVVWAFLALKRKSEIDVNWIALSCAAALTMLLTYHRPYDAKVLLVAIPACATLWNKGRVLGWIAFATTTLGILMTSDIPLAISIEIARSLHITTEGLGGKILTVLFTRPASVVLLLNACFYLWIYRRSSTAVKLEGHNPSYPAAGIAPSQ